MADQRGPNDTDAAPITATGVYQNIHTVVPVNLFPWGWSSTHMPNYNETRNIAAHMAAPNAGGNGYPFGSIIDQLYPVDGGSIDWAYGELGMAAFSTELSGQDFLPSYSCIDNPGCGSSQGIWPENRGMLLYLAKIARTPYLLSHGPDANTVVTNPALVPQGVSSQLTASINFAWSSNGFSQNVGAAEYYIDTPPWAGGTAIPMSGGFTSPTVAVNATIDTAGLSLGRHIIFVRGRGVTDFQGFQTWGPISAAFLDVIGAPVPSSAVSRKVHGAFTGDINLPVVAIGGAVGIECRNGAGVYQMVVTFPSPVTVSGVAVTSGTGSATFGGSGTAVITVDLTGVTDAQRLGVTLMNVNDGTSTGDVLVPMGVLIGDSVANGTVNAGDVGFVKSQSGVAVGAGNFRADVAINGTINASDIGQVKANSGHTLPP